MLCWRVLMCRQVESDTGRSCQSTWSTCARGSNDLIFMVLGTRQWSPAAGGPCLGTLSCHQHILGSVTSHFVMKLKVVAWVPQDSLPLRGGWESIWGCLLVMGTSGSGELRTLL